MVKSVLQKPLSEVHLQRNAFDVGYTNKFTSSLGMLLPCFVRECNPNEHYKINPRMFLRSMPMNSAAFIQCTQHVEFYFVPYRLLWYYFPQFITGTLYPTDNDDLGTRSQVPNFDLGKTLFSLHSSYASVIKGNEDKIGTDVLGYSKTSGALRLLDLLGYGDGARFEFANIGSNINHFDTCRVSLLRLLAYQKICSDFYRVARYERNRIDAYNVGLRSAHQYDDIAYESFLELHYRPWKRDIFTISDTQFQGADFMTSNAAGAFDAPVMPNSPNANARVQSPTNSNDKIVGVGVAANSLTGFSIANLRSAFALDKLYRLQSQAADGDYKSQMRARYGFDAYAPTTKADFIGSSSSVVKIDTVTTTADTLYSDHNDGTPAGRIYGNGVGASNGDFFEYDTKEHGIIMGISSFVPDVDYSSYGLNPFNKKLQRSDFFQPEFDNLGKQPLTSDMLNLWNLVNNTTNPELPTLKGTPNTAVLGWFPRYVEYKTHVDEVHGELNGYINRSPYSSPTLGLWTAPRLNASDTKKFERWCQFGFNRSFFYIDPSLYDSIFVNQYQGLQSQDQFICEVNNNVQAVLPMSVSGEPLI